MPDIEHSDESVDPSDQAREEARAALKKLTRDRIEALTADLQRGGMSADDFLNERRDHLAVCCVEVEPGCFDIVLKIDGTYFDRDAAMAATEAFARDIHRRIGGAVEILTYPREDEA